MIPDNIVKVLSLGEKFALPLAGSNKIECRNACIDIIKNFECSCISLADDVTRKARSTICNCLRNVVASIKHVKYIDRLMTGMFVSCKRFLKRNKDIFITKADKGQVTVIMDRFSYMNQITDLLSDHTTYKRLNKNPIGRLTTRFNDLIKSWLSNGLIDDFTYKKLYNTTYNISRCYGLPKVHKINNPLCIIVSAIGSPCYNVARFLHDILVSSVPEPRSHVGDSWNFVGTISGLEIGKNETLVSLDVTSLFTNIPVDLVLKSIENRWHLISGATTFSLEQFKCVIETVLGSTSFKFGDVFMRFLVVLWVLPCRLYWLI